MLNSTESFIEMTVFCFAFVETHDHDYVVGFIYRLFCTIYLFIFMCCCCCWVASVVSDSVRPHRRQPTRLRRPWDSPGKNTRVGCHFLLQCMKVKSESEVAQSHPIPRDPMDCSPPGSSVHGICQARVLDLYIYINMGVFIIPSLKKNSWFFSVIFHLFLSLLHLNLVLLTQKEAYLLKGYCAR